jgi:hypothetical protein
MKSSKIYFKLSMQRWEKISYLLAKPLVLESYEEVRDEV